MNPKDDPKDAPKEAPAEEEEEDDLFGSDDEEEDPEAVKQREANLAAYKKKKEGKTKPAAKSIVTLDVKPWGMQAFSFCHHILLCTGLAVRSCIANVILR
jgi:hypothetical protein